MTTTTKTRTLHAVACRCNRRRGPVYRDAQGRVVEGLASLPPAQSQDAAAMDEDPWRERTTGPPWPREYSPVNVPADPRAMEVTFNAEATGDHTIMAVAAEYGPHVCTRCWGRGWYWSDGLPPVSCANGIPCGRRSGTCSACKRSDAEIIEQAWNEDAALIAVRLRQMDGEMRAQWLRHLGEQLRDIAPMASDALKAGV